MARLLPAAEYVYFNRNDISTYINLQEQNSETPEAIINQVPEEIQENKFKWPAEYLMPLAIYPSGWKDDDKLKVKSIYDWIVMNIRYDLEGYDSSIMQVVDPYITLRHQKGVCAGYVNLFNVMARIGGLDPYYITGYAMTGVNSKYALADTGMVRHAWNGVRIGNHWYLVDTTWDSQYDKYGKPVYFNKYLKYLFIEAVDLIQSHYPESPGWMLLEEYMGIEEFIAR